MPDDSFVGESRRGDGRARVYTDAAPAPVGTYSQGIRHGATLYIAGQTPRLPSGERLLTAPFAVQARQALENLENIAVAGGSSLRHALQLTVYLLDMADAPAFEDLLREYVGPLPPVRAIVPAPLTVGAIELTAIVALPNEQSTDDLRAESRIRGRTVADG